MFSNKNYSIGKGLEFFYISATGVSFGITLAGTQVVCILAKIVITRFTEDQLLLLGLFRAASTLLGTVLIILSLVGLGLGLFACGSTKQALPLFAILCIILLLLILFEVKEIFYPSEFFELCFLCSVFGPPLVICCSLACMCLGAFAMLVLDMLSNILNL